MAKKAGGKGISKGKTPQKQGASATQDASSEEEWRREEDSTLNLSVESEAEMREMVERQQEGAAGGQRGLVSLPADAPRLSSSELEEIRKFLPAFEQWLRLQRSARTDLNVGALIIGLIDTDASDELRIIYPELEDEDDDQIWLRVPKQAVSPRDEIEAREAVEAIRLSLPLTRSSLARYCLDYKRLVQNAKDAGREEMMPSEGAMVRAFVRNLNPAQVRQAVQAKDPTSLVEAMRASMDFGGRYVDACRLSGKSESVMEPAPAQKVRKNTELAKPKDRPVAHTAAAGRSNRFSAQRGKAGPGAPKFAGCYTCGEMGHMARACPKASAGERTNKERRSTGQVKST